MNTINFHDPNALRAAVSFAAGPGLAALDYFSSQDVLSRHAQPAALSANPAPVELAKAVRAVALGIVFDAGPPEPRASEVIAALTAYAKEHPDYADTATLKIAFLNQTVNAWREGGRDAALQVLREYRTASLKALILSRLAPSAKSTKNLALVEYRPPLTWEELTSGLATEIRRMAPDAAITIREWDADGRAAQILRSSSGDHISLELRDDRFLRPAWRAGTALQHTLTEAGWTRPHPPEPRWPGWIKTQPYSAGSSADHASMIITVLKDLYGVPSPDRLTYTAVLATSAYPLMLPALPLPRFHRNHGIKYIPNFTPKDLPDTAK